MDLMGNRIQELGEPALDGRCSMVSLLSTSNREAGFLSEHEGPSECRHKHFAEPKERDAWLATKRRIFSQFG